jgi:hypothetical protein
MTVTLYSLFGKTGCIFCDEFAGGGNAVDACELELEMSMRSTLREDDDEAVDDASGLRGAFATTDFGGGTGFADCDGGFEVGFATGGALVGAAWVGGWAVDADGPPGKIGLGLKNEPVWGGGIFGAAGTGGEAVGLSGLDPALPWSGELVLDDGEPRPAM